MNMAWLRPLISKTRLLAVKNAPGILMAMGTTSSITAVIFAAKVTPAAAQAKKDAEFIKSNGGEDVAEEGRSVGIFQKDMEKLTPIELLKACGKYYIPALGMELFSLICFWGAHGIDIHRQALLAASAATAEQALTVYQKKVTEMFGKEGEQEVRKSLGQNKVDANPPPTVILAGDNDQWCMYENQYFRSSWLKIKNAEVDANREMINHIYISKAELMWLLDTERKYLKPEPNDGQIGWNLDRKLVLDVQTALGPEHQPVLLVTVTDENGLDYAPQAGFSALY